MKTISCMVLALALLVPADAEAQRRSNAYRYNAYSFSPYAGVLMDAYDAEADGSNLGWIAGFRAGYRESPRFNVHLNLGYAQTGDVAPRPIAGAGTIFDNQWVLLTAGGDFALVPGNTSVALGADLGVGWLRTRPEDGSTGPTGWSAHEVVAPGLTIRHQFTPRAGIFGSVQDYIFDLLDGAVQHSPAITLGLTVR
ncbi:MAG: hypothetical protein ACRELT_00915 [Longimicrobiales bacterium]